MLEPQSNSRTTPAIPAATATEKAYLIFNKLTSNLEERSLVEAADMDPARDRAHLGKSFTMEDFEEESGTCAKEVEEGVENTHDVSMMISEIEGKEHKGEAVQRDERTETVASACQRVQLVILEKRLSLSREETRAIVARGRVASWSGSQLVNSPSGLVQALSTD